MRRGTILVVCGLRREAAIAAGPDVVALAGGGDRHALEGRLASLDPETIAAVISFGLAGALDPGLRVGAPVCPDLIVTQRSERLPVDGRLRRAWRAKLGSDDLSSKDSVIAGVDAPVLLAQAKARLAAETGAEAVDIESHIAAAYAARIGVAFGVLRVISDDAGRTLPPAAAIAMRPDGSIDLAGVALSLVREPGQIPALIATARDAAVAFRQLRRVRGLLGPRFGLHL